MIKNPIKKTDLKKFGLTKNLFEELQVLMDSKEYVEIASQKLFLGVKEDENMSVIYIENEEDAIFFKNVRDNLNDIKIILKNKNIINKIKTNSINTSNFFISYIIRNKIRNEIQVRNLYKKLVVLNEILQKVFIISGSYNEFLNNFDTCNTVFIFTTFEESMLSVISKIRYAAVILFIDKASVPYKKLKSLGMKNLSSKKESTKYIWHKMSK
jgi:hypothetical protein